MERLSDKLACVIEDSRTAWDRNEESVLKSAIDRLAYYEDMGLEPQEINGLKLKIQSLEMSLNVACDALKKFTKAEQEGRLVVLPAKQRSRVWLTEWWKNSFEWEKMSIPIERHIIYFSVEVDGVYAHFKDGCLHTKYFGKVAFLTREEAEQALKGGADHVE